MLDVGPRALDPGVPGAYTHLALFQLELELCILCKHTSDQVLELGIACGDGSGVCNCVVCISGIVLYDSNIACEAHSSSHRRVSVVVYVCLHAARVFVSPSGMCANRGCDAGAPCAVGV